MLVQFTAKIVLQATAGPIEPAKTLTSVINMVHIWLQKVFNVSQIIVNYLINCLINRLMHSVAKTRYQQTIWTSTISWVIGPDKQNKNEPVHEISNNVVCATSKASDQTAHTHSLIRAFASRLSIL